MIAEELSDTRDVAQIGRSARLELVFERRGARTVLAHGYAEPPLRVGRSFAEAGGLHLIMASSAPGIFGGDAFEQHVHVARGARVRLTSQSALQVHASADRAPATLRSRYVVDDGASLVCAWHPLIPFAGSHLAQHVEIHLGAGATLYWSDAFMSGRVAKHDGEGDGGERWAFGNLAYELRVARSSRDLQGGPARGATLDYLERFRISPLERRIGLPWTTGDAHYFGTTIASGWQIDGERVERCHRALQEIEGVRTAVDLVEADLVVARAIAATGVPFHDARSRLYSSLFSLVEP